MTQIDENIEAGGEDFRWETPSRVPFLRMPTTKVVIMTFVTTGLYSYYWHYRQWSHVKETTGEGLMPFWRTVFSGIWTFGLASRVEAAAASKNLSLPVSLTALAVGNLIGNVLWRSPDPYWLICIPIITTVLGVFQVSINRIAPESSAKFPYFGFSLWDMVGLFLGAVLWYFVFFGLAYPDPALGN